MSNFHKCLFLSVAIIAVAFVSLNFPALAYAMIPTITSIVSTGNGDYVQINVTGDPNASVFLRDGSYAIFLGDLSPTGIGQFSLGSSQSENQNVSIASNTMVYVTTGGINGTSSSSVSWPYMTGLSAANNLTLSQNGGLSTSTLALLLNAGQTSIITASANYLYVLSNTTPAIANINLNANQITVTANTYGSTVANVCVVGSTTNCANITVTVQNSSTQQLTFSQNNFSIYSGQSIPVTIIGGSGVYTISNNSNPSAVQANLNGSVVTLIANSTSGASSITVCTTDMNYCGIINVSASTINSTAITFSQTNPVVPFGQSTTVTIYGGTGTNFYVASNSNPSIAQANINSNILTLVGNASVGTSAISICAYAGSCASLTANVSNASSSGAISLSQNSVSILAGQSSNITISGGSTPYSLSANSSNIFNGVVNGNILTIYGVNPGTATANVCSSAGCTVLSVTINSIASTINPPTFSQNNILLNVGQQATVYISGNSGYYIANNTGANIASASISASAVVVSAINAGSANISVCQSGGQCATLYVTVSGSASVVQLLLSQTSLSLTPGQSTTVYITGNGGYYISSNPSSGIASSAISGSSIIVNAISIGTDNISICQSGGQCAILYVTVSGQTVTTNAVTPAIISNYIFSRYLFYGVNGDDVLQLQKVLSEKGFLSATPNGHYGLATVEAVKKFQKAHNIDPLGAVGPSTRSILNALLIPAAASNSANTTKEQQISTIQQAISQLLAQIAQLQK